MFKSSLCSLQQVWRLHKIRLRPILLRLNYFEAFSLLVLLYSKKVNYKSSRGKCFKRQFKEGIRGAFRIFSCHLSRQQKFMDFGDSQCWEKLPNNPVFFLIVSLLDCAYSINRVSKILLFKAKGVGGWGYKFNLTYIWIVQNQVFKCMALGGGGIYIAQNRDGVAFKSAFPEYLRLNLVPRIFTEKFNIFSWRDPSPKNYLSSNLIFLGGVKVIWPKNWPCRNQKSWAQSKKTPYFCPKYEVWS